MLIMIPWEDLESCSFHAIGVFWHEMVVLVPIGFRQMDPQGIEDVSHVVCRDFQVQRHDHE